MKNTIEKMAKDVKKGDRILSLGGAGWLLKGKEIEAVHQRNNGTITELVVGGRRYWFGFNEMIELPAPKRPSWWVRQKTAFIKWISKKLKVKVKVG